MRNPTLYMIKIHKKLIKIGNGGSFAVFVLLNYFFSGLERRT